MSVSRVFFVARGDTLRDGLFGHLFDGADLVFGTKGMQEFQQATDRKVSFGEDGSYVLLRRTRSGFFRIGTDYNGHGKIFLYRYGDRWAVSNSFYRLVVGVSDIGWPLTLDSNHLASFFAPRALGAQLMSLRTSVQEIELLPSYGTLLVDRCDVFFDPWLYETACPKPDYPAALSSFLSVWISRLATLLRSGGQVVCDLSGGLDSRTTFALTLAAGRLVGNAGLEGVHINSNRSSVADYAVAEQLAARMGIPLHIPANPFAHYQQGSESSYEAWKTSMLGTYGPVFWPVVTDGQKIFWIGGEGGESNRRFYNAESPEALFAACSEHMPKGVCGEILRRDALEDLRKMSRRTKASDPIILHYRQFRERFHGARRSAYSQAVSPLASLYAKDCADVSGTDRVNSGQMLRDIIENTVPELLDIPFASETAPNGSEAASETLRLTGWEKDVRCDGRIFGFPNATRRSGTFRTRECFARLDEDFRSVLPVSRSLDVFPAAYVELARKRLKDALNDPQSLGPNDARVVSHVLLGGVLGQMSEQPRAAMSSRQAPPASRPRASDSSRAAE